MAEKEEFRDIKGYEGHYQVSNFGRVKSIKFHKEQILKCTTGPKGYPLASLSMGGFVKHIRVHQLVAIVFLGHKPDGHKLIIDHKDGVKDNNHISNLRIVTNRENCSTCFRSKKHTYSSKYVGVYWFKRDKRWKAHIRINGKLERLGSFDCEKEASKAYQKALKEHLQNNQTKK